MKRLQKTRASAGSPSVAGYRLDDQVGFRLRLAMQCHTDIFFRNMDMGLTQPQFAAMARLYTHGACSQNQLGRTIALDSASMVGVISRLRVRKFVTTSKDPEDKRRTVISLTQPGRQAIEAAIEKGIVANEITLSPLTVSERRKLIELLRKMAPGDDAGSE